MINDRYFADRMRVLPSSFTSFATILYPNKLLLTPLSKNLKITVHHKEIVLCAALLT